MKRGLTLLLASLLLAVSLSACGGDTRKHQNGDSVLDGGNGSANDSYQPPDGGTDGKDNSASGNGTGDAITGGVRDGMEDIQNGLDDAVRDAGDAMDGVVDDLTGNSAGARSTPQSSGGPAWQGNLKKPSFPGSAGSSF